MTSRLRHLFAAALVVASLGAAPAARADDASEAQLNYELGQAYYSQGRYLEAVERFLTSYRLVPNPQVAFNIAQVYGLLDRPVDAYNWNETVLGLSPSAETAQLATAARDALGPRVAVVEVTSTPPGAEIFIDRIELGAWGRAPRRVAVDAGERTIRLRLDGYHEASTVVTAVVGRSVPASASLEAITGVVVVRTEPAGARIVRDDTGEALGVSPLEVALPIGDVRLRAVLEGRIDATADVTVAEGERREVDLHLSMEASEVATLSVTGAPEGARIRLRSEILGAVPFTRSDLTPGTADIEIEADGLETYRAVLLLEAGSATRVDVMLRPPVSWDWPVFRVLLYTSAALLAGGGAVTGGMALAQHDAFFASPTRSALDAIEPLAISSDVLIGAGAVLAVATFVADLLSSPPRASTAETEIER
jgi:outer membrane receptor for ferrienterochelin and colicins